MDKSAMDKNAMDHSTMDHSTMDHSTVDPSTVDPSTMTGSDGGMVMTHPGFPFEWGVALWAVMALCVVRALLRPTAHIGKTNHFTLRNIPGLGSLIAYVTTRPWVLFTLKLIFVALFLLIIAADFSGTPLAERNAATALLALFMVVLATLSLSLFERNPYCQFFCPVGRTIGFYSQNQYPPVVIDAAHGHAVLTGRRG